MSSTMAMWDYAVPFSNPHVEAMRWRCARCGEYIRKPRPGKRYCTETCRKRAERARWKAKWKAKGVNKYIGGRSKDE